MSQEDPLFFLNHQSYGTYSRDLAKKLKSLNTAVFLAELIETRRLAMIKKELTSNEKHGDGWIYRTIDDVEDRTALSRYEQETCIKVLLKFDLIETVNFGLPCKRYFRLKDEEILDLFGLSKKLSRKGETNKLDGGKPSNRSAENQQTTLYTKEPKEEPNVVVVGQPAPASASLMKITKDDVYSRSLTHKKDWTAAEIEIAYPRYVKSNLMISDHLEFIDGIIKNIRINNQIKQNEDKKCKPMTKKTCPQPQEIMKKKPNTSKENCSVPDTSVSPLAIFARQNGYSSN